MTDEQRRNYARLMTDEEAQAWRVRNRLPPCTYCDLGAAHRNAKSEPVCERHRTETAELPPDQRRSLVAWRTRRERAEDEGP